MPLERFFLLEPAHIGWRIEKAFCLQFSCYIHYIVYFIGMCVLTSSEKNPPISDSPVKQGMWMSTKSLSLGHHREQRLRLFNLDQSLVISGQQYEPIMKLYCTIGNYCHMNLNITLSHKKKVSISNSECTCLKNDFKAKHI